MFKELFPNVFALVSIGDGSNVFLLKGRRKIALVDSSGFFNRGLLFKGLSGLSITPEKVSLILHTHGHADHFGCDEFFPKARVAMHKGDAGMVNGKNGEFACTSFFPGTEMPCVSVNLRNGQKIGLGGLSLEVIHTPGHTPGSACFFLRGESALFSGDTLFAEGFGRTDLMGGDSKKMAESLKKLQKMPLKVLLPGHGPVLSGETQITQALQRSVELASASAFL